MKCDNCGDDCRQATVCDETAGAYWCDRCCQAAGIKVMRGAVEFKNEIRERWEAEQKAKKRAKLDEFLASRGKIVPSASQAAKKATPEVKDMSEYKKFEPCKHGQHDDCTLSYWADENLTVAFKCNCSCHGGDQKELFSAPRRESKQPSLFN